jgi:hypothetical protein
MRYRRLPHPALLHDEVPRQIFYRIPAPNIGRTAQGMEGLSVVLEDDLRGGAQGSERRRASRWVGLKLTRERVKGS